MIFGLGKSVINIPEFVYNEVLAHVKESYPHECCGVLVGSNLKDKRVFASHRVENINKDRARDRYNIDAREINMIDRQSRAEGLEIIGFYHSHPDHPDKPSEYDREWGHPGYSYVIVAVKGGNDTSARSWIFEEDNEPFREEKIRVTQ